MLCAKLDMMKRIEELETEIEQLVTGLHSKRIQDFLEHYPELKGRDLFKHPTEES